MRIVVIGGTGKMGTRVVRDLLAMGHDAVPASPRSGVNSVTGEGLAGALTGTEVVIDLIEARSMDMGQVEADFVQAAGNLATQGEHAGVRHTVVLSVVGTPQLQMSGYFRAKLAQEMRTAEGGVPFTIVRATQFFEFLGSVADMHTVDGTVCLPSADVQCASADEVSATIAKIAVGPSMNGVVEVAGPKRQPLAEIVGAWLRCEGDRRPVNESSNAQFAGAKIGRDTLVPSTDALLMPTTFDAWLAGHRPGPA